MKRRTRLTIIFLIALLIIPLIPLAASAQTDPIPWPTEGWQTSTPEEQGMDSEKLAELINYLQEQNGFTIHSLLIIRRGYIVTDAYFYPYVEGNLHDLASATKSFSSTLIGIAIDQGYIKGVEQPVLGLFPERTVANLDANKKAMTVEDLLTMRSGLQCSGESSTMQMMASPNWTQFALDVPMTGEPGAIYNYCGLNSHLLSSIIQESTGMGALEFAQQHLFGPLGISDVIWPADPQGNNWGWGDLKLAPHDMAKLGYLFVNEGRWEDQQVVSATWIESATSGLGYGYQWWLKPSGYYFATGVGGQEIWVLPDRDMVVVITGASGEGGTGAWGDRLMNSYVIPLAESETPLPANPDGVALLQSRIEQAALSPPPEPVPPMPALAEQISGQTIIMDPNPVGLESGTLTFTENADAILSLSFGSAFQIEWQIGLDNVYRYSVGMDGLLSIAKGEWESHSVFVFQLEEIGGRARNRYRMVFEGKRVTIEIKDLNGRDPVLSLTGTFEE